MSYPPPHAGVSGVRSSSAKVIVVVDPLQLKSVALVACGGGGSIDQQITT